MMSFWLIHLSLDPPDFTPQTLSPAYDASLGDPSCVRSAV
jgi:hypothetical protein